MDISLMLDRAMHPLSSDSAPTGGVRHLHVLAAPVWAAATLCRAQRPAHAPHLTANRYSHNPSWRYRRSSTCPPNVGFLRSRSLALTLAGGSPVVIATSFNVCQS